MMNRLKPLTNKKNIYSVQLDGFYTRCKGRVGDGRCYYYNLWYKNKFIPVGGEATDVASDRNSSSFNQRMKNQGKY